MRLLLSIFLITALLTGQQRQQADLSKEKSAPTVEVANTNFRYSPEVSVIIHALRGRLVPTEGHDLTDFNHPESFVIVTDAAEVAMSTAQLANLMNSYMFSSPDAQIKNIRLSAQGGALHINGTLKKGIHLSFEATATPSVTADNRVRFTVSKMKGGSFPIKGLMDAFGINLEKVVSDKGLKGVSVDGDSLLVDPQTAFPPPQLRGKLTSVRLAGDNLILVFGSGARRLDRSKARNYMAIRGGNIRYGRDEMSDSDLIMIDTTPSDPFDFYLGEYRRQFGAGYVKTTPDMGLRAYIPDYGKLPKSTTPKKK